MALEPSLVIISFDQKIGRIHKGYYNRVLCWYLEGIEVLKH